MEEQERIEEDSMPQKHNDGRDELNLADFPLCALAHRLLPEQKTLRFEDRLWDDRRGANYEYGPFGEVLRVSGSQSAQNPFRFSTKFTDDESGLVYYGYRYYNPYWGRWITTSDEF